MSQAARTTPLRDRLRDPRGWLLDSLPWPLRRLYLAAQLHERPKNIPDDCRIIGFRRPPDYVIAYFRRLHGLEDK